jgi:hypothetical protein
MNKGFSFQKALPYLGALVIFILIALVYFRPVVSGKKLSQHDIKVHIGSSKEINDFRENTGEEPLWTNSMFGGMPAFQISVLYKNNIANFLDKIFRLGLPHPMNILFLLFAGFFILLIVLKVDPWLSVLGAIAFAFSSYFFIIIQAGHNSKALAIAYMSPVFAGIIAAYRGKYLLGALLTAVFLAIEIKVNHLQITYYYLFIILFFGILELYNAISLKKLPTFLKATVVLVIAALIAVSVNFSALWSTYESGKYTTRGKTELTLDKDDETTGLPKSYITDWSYGPGETWSLVIPNVKGGASGYLAENEKAMEKVDARFRNDVARQNHYWGDQKFTSGPVYAGAIVVFLFILGLIIVRSRFKWVLLTATILSFIFAWGKHIPGITDWIIDNLPGYNKFRAVSMALVIAEFCIPLLAVLTLKTIIDKPEIFKEKKKQIYISFGITAGIVFLFFLMPTVFFKFFSHEEFNAWNQQKIDNPQSAAVIDQFLNSIKVARISIFKADALRSFFFILLGGSTLFLFFRKRIGKIGLIAILAVLIIIDMGFVNWRYLNTSHFERKRLVQQPYQPTNADKVILKDEDPNFRVYNATVSTFNDASTSYYHKSIGGYHGAKLQRIQDLIDFQISKNNMRVLDMLNTKYFIIQNQQNGQPEAQINFNAMGHAWFVENIKLVENADSEMVALGNFNPHKEVLVDQRFADYVKSYTASRDTTASITLEEYAPNMLRYSTSTTQKQFAVFSEIYYPAGWNVYIDKKPAEYIRVNYLLRGMIVPEGKHEIVFKFEPRSYYTGEKISLAGSILLMLLLVGTIAFEVRKRLKKPEEKEQ